MRKEDAGRYFDALAKDHPGSTWTREAQRDRLGLVRPEGAPLLDAVTAREVETLLFDLATRDWAWDLIDRLEFPRRLFPKIRESGSRLGELSVAAAADLGLAPGTPVAVGGAE